MDEQEIFAEMELRQAKDSMVKMSDNKADEFVIRRRDRLETSHCIKRTD